MQHPVIKFSTDHYVQARCGNRLLTVPSVQTSFMIWSTKASAADGILLRARARASLRRWMEGKGAALHFGSRRDFRRFAAHSLPSRVRQMMHFPRAKSGNEALLTLGLSHSLALAPETNGWKTNSEWSPRKWLVGEGIHSDFTTHSRRDPC